jgi:hypothetical protein
MIIATDYRPLPAPKNTLVAFLTLRLSPSGVVLNECMLHRKENRSWIGLPSRPQTNKDGTPRIDPKTGKPAWQPIVEIPGKEERQRFQQAALVAVDKLLSSLP